MRPFFLKTTEIIYRAVRPLFFLTDSERIHERLLFLGGSLGSHLSTKNLIQKAYRVKSSALEQMLHGVRFENPIGLAAGFDYGAKLTQILPAIGFGFGTVGTITNKPCEGNPQPRLGRLVKSRSLLVNKGFRNLGIRKTLEKLAGANFDIPVGLSIGKTNVPEVITQADAAEDIVDAFTFAESSRVPFGYYELNISCPNLCGNVEFYSLAHLADLLSHVTGLKLSKPLFIKMPTDRTDEETRQMLDTIINFPVQGVIFGNLQKNRRDPSLDQEEIKKYQKGYFSGKPTERISNELIRLAYKNYGQKLTIIGCGGVFSAEDAYKKIKLGASLVQLITGLIFMGPQLPAQINLGLAKLLQKDGYSNISQAIGKAI